MWLQSATGIVFVYLRLEQRRLKAMPAPAERFRHGAAALAVEAIDPEPMALDDVQYTGTLNLAHTPLGLRLMQVEMETAVRSVERLTARIETFDGGAFGDARLAPVRVIASSVVTMDAAFPPVRFVCKPEELAFTGTEAV